MAAVEYGECPLIHTSRLARFEYGIRVLEVYFFSPDLNWNVLRTQILRAQYGQYGYWNTAQGSLRLSPDHAHFWQWKREPYLTFAFRTDPHPPVEMRH
ncbi:unnamed protein product [Arctogadus glacialis]